jgi:hypothetical protein
MNAPDTLVDFHTGGDAIAIGSYGDCRAVAPRKCQYFTVLRDPVARRVSEYDWFCRACKEGNKYCGRLVMACPPPGDPAPPPTLEAWAQRSPNVYTQIFSREESCGGYSALVAGPTRLDADAYARAAAALAAPDMLVLTTEGLDNGWGRLDTYLGRQPGEGIAKPTARANVYSGDRYRYRPKNSFITGISGWRRLPFRLPLHSHPAARLAAALDGFFLYYRSRMQC